MMFLYKLNGKEIEPVEDAVEWAKWHGNADNRIVHSDMLPEGIYVSTIFLGIGSAIMNMPKLFETMIFGGEHDCYIERYATWNEAEEGHQRAIKLVFSIKDQQTIDAEFEIIKPKQLT